MNTYPKYIHITHISIFDILIINRSRQIEYQSISTGIFQLQGRNITIKTSIILSTLHLS